MYQTQKLFLLPQKYHSLFPKLRLLAHESLHQLLLTKTAISAGKIAPTHVEIYYFNTINKFLVKKKTYRNTEAFLDTCLCILFML